MNEIKFRIGDLLSSEQEIINDGFAKHSSLRSAPLFQKNRLNWLMHNEQKDLIGVLTADLLWDWIYIDELWVDESLRGKGLGIKLINEVENYATKKNLVSLWLWTQSWQAAEFYMKLGYEEFTRFPDFPRGHQRIGFRKIL